MPIRKKTSSYLLAHARSVADGDQSGRELPASAIAGTANEEISIPVSITMTRPAADRLRAFMAHGQNRFVIASSDGALSVRVAMMISRSSSTEEIVPHVGNAAIDWDRATISREGRAAALSRTELRLLACLVEHAGETVPHDVLISSAWGVTADDAGYNALAVYVCYLRRSLKSIGLGQALRTARGVGYALGDPSKAVREPNAKSRSGRYRPPTLSGKRNGDAPTR
ncbi:MAG: winged helix-turn-helix domain-containing protein [Gemmatimonadaceae bacterium]